MNVSATEINMNLYTNLDRLRKQSLRIDMGTVRVTALRINEAHRQYVREQKDLHHERARAWQVDGMRDFTQILKMRVIGQFKALNDRGIHCGL